MVHENVRIHPSADVSDLALIGEGTSIWHQAQIRERASIGKGCNIGKGVYIDFDVVLGDHVKVQNYVSVYHGVRVGDRVFLGPHCVFTNDLYPRAANSEFEVSETFVDEGASIGANAVVVCGHRIGRYAMVGSGSVVTRDVAPYRLVVGNPARPIGYVCVCGRKMVGKEGTIYHCDHCDRDIDVKA